MDRYSSTLYHLQIVWDFKINSKLIFKIKMPFVKDFPGMNGLKYWDMLWVVITL